MVYKNNLSSVESTSFSLLLFIHMGYSDVAERLKSAVSFEENRNQVPAHLLVKMNLDKSLKLLALVSSPAKYSY